MPDSWDYSSGRPPTAGQALHTPILTRAVVAVCVLFTLASQTAGLTSWEFWRALGRFGHLSAEAIWSGHYGGLLTTVFVHGSPRDLVLTVMHLGFNSLWLLILGAILEATIHPALWALFFVCAAVVGSGAELAVSGQTGVGASGVVYAMFGLLWAGRREVPLWRQAATPENLRVFLGWGLICVVLTWLGLFRIANAAHGGGFLFGLLAGWLFVARRHRVLAAAGLAALAALAACSATWMPWSPRWTVWRGDTAASRGDFAQAAAWYARAARLERDPRAAIDVLQKLEAAETARGNARGAEAAYAEIERRLDILIVRPRTPDAPDLR